MDTKAECDQLNLAHVARKKVKTEETKTNTSAHCPLTSVLYAFVSFQSI